MLSLQLIRCSNFPEHWRVLVTVHEVEVEHDDHNPHGVLGVEVCVEQEGVGEDACYKLWLPSIKWIAATLHPFLGKPRAKSLVSQQVKRTNIM